MFAGQKVVHVFHGVHNTTIVENYHATNNMLNSFLSAFDVWSGRGRCAVCSDDNHIKMSYEMHADFYDMMKTESFKTAMRFFGVSVVYDL